jgi:hypothetical protein
VPSLFLLPSLYDSSTSLVGRRCLGYVSSGCDTSDACINFHGLVSNRSHSRASCSVGRQPLVAQPPQSSLPWTISVSSSCQSHCFHTTHSKPTDPNTAKTPNTNAMSSTLSYLHAKSILSEVEKDRIVCTYLNSTEPNAVSCKPCSYISPT